LIAAIIGINIPKKIGTNIMIGKSESLEGEFELEPRSRNPIIKKIKKTTTPINNKNTAIKTRTFLSNLYQQPVTKLN